MSYLEEVLIKNELVKDHRTARPLIKEGFVKVNNQIVKNPDLPTSAQDEIRILDKKLASLPYPYWKFREIQKKFGLIKPTTNALCFGLDDGEVLFLLDEKADITAILFEEKELSKKISTRIRTIKGNPIHEDLSGKIEGKIDLMINGLDINLFNVFKIIERYLPKLVKKGRILIKLNTKKEDLSVSKRIVGELAKSINLVIIDYVKPDYSRYEVWALLKKR